MSIRRRIPLLIGLVILSWTLKVSAKVVVTEVQWAGSDLSTADEWVELVCIVDSKDGAESEDSGESNDVCNVSAWTLTSLNSKNEESVIARFATGATIGSGGYLVIANATASGSRLLTSPWLQTSAISLPNSKLLLRLRTMTGLLMDVVDDGIGVPFAGVNKIKASSGSGLGSGRLVWASMERMNLSASGQLKTNWRSATTFRGFDDGAPLFGTPGFANGSGPSVDRFPPIEASDLQAWTESGSLLILWKPSPSLDLVSQSISFLSGTGTSTSSGSRIILLPRTATGWTMPDLCPVETATGGNILVGLCMSGTLVTLQSTDHLVNISSGSTTRVQPFMKRNNYEQNNSSNSECPLFDAAIHIQSGFPVATGKVTINVEATATGVSLSKLHCQFDFSDGLRRDSCNPAGHTFTEPGIHTITLKATDQCGSTVKRWIDVEVLRKQAEEKEEIEAIDEIDDRCLTLSGAHLLESSLIISEVLPNPFGDEEAGEWIELQNQSAFPISLCGWSLADTASLKHPYALSGSSLGSGAFLVLPRHLTKIALNNDQESVSLLHRTSSGASNIYNLAYSRAPKDYSYSIDDDGVYRWTPTTTSGAVNILPHVTYALHADPPSGLVHTGSGIHLRIVAIGSGSIAEASPQNPHIYVSLNSGAYIESSGSVLIHKDTSLRAYAEVSPKKSLRTPILAQHYEVIRERYDGDVVISEISPMSGVCVTRSSGSLSSSSSSTCPEWIELHNRGSHDVSLSGWQIDDIAAGGSKKVFMPFGFHIGSGSFAVLSGSLLKISLNDDGDDVRLIDPAGGVHDMVIYPKIKKGYTYSQAEGWCMTTRPTPGLRNICVMHSLSSRQSSSAFSHMTLIPEAIIEAKAGLVLPPQQHSSVGIRRAAMRGHITSKTTSSMPENIAIMTLLSLSGLVLTYAVKMRK